MLCHGDIIERDGREFRVEIVPDENMGPPWEEHDGHGVVTGWSSDEPADYQWTLTVDRGRRLLYDSRASLEVAKRDGWDAPPYGGAADERAARAVEADFDYLRRYCEGLWGFVGVVVTARCPKCGEFTGPSESLWGIESDSDDYMPEVVYELIGEISA